MKRPPGDGLGGVLVPTRTKVVFGTETAQKYANVLVPFVVFERGVLRYFNILGAGNIVVRDVPALVHSDEALGVNLLGMSFLSRVRWTHERGKLIIEQ
jgi:hypothetical protein